MESSKFPNGILHRSAHRPKRESECEAPRIPPDMIRALRSDHAGESGAVQIYRGVLAVSRNDAVRAFAYHHLATEQRHLKLMSDTLPPALHSRLLPLWRVAGWLTGAIPALFGATALYRTIDAVESFVDQHYAEQVETLRHRPEDWWLYRLLEDCQSDEIAHRNDARGHLGRPGWIARVWVAIVTVGSRAGVYVAGRV